MLGAGVSVTAMLLVTWFLALNLANGPFPTVARGIKDSAILQAMAATLPPPPPLVPQLERFADVLGFPDVFIGLPSAGEPTEPPSSAAVQAAKRAAAGSTVQVFRRGARRASSTRARASWRRRAGRDERPHHRRRDRHLGAVHEPRLRRDRRHLRAEPRPGRPAGAGPDGAGAPIGHRRSPEGSGGRRTRLPGCGRVDRRARGRPPAVRAGGPRRLRSRGGPAPALRARRGRPGRQPAGLSCCRTGGSRGSSRELGPRRPGRARRAGAGPPRDRRRRGPPARTAGGRPRARRSNPAAPG